MMKKLVFYIVFGLFFFNSWIALGNSFEEVNETGIEKNYIVKDLTYKDVSKVEKKKPLIKGNNSFVTFFMLPYIIDKLYPEDEIYEDVSVFLKEVYPNTDIEKLKYLGDVYKAFIITKREYKKTIAILKQSIKAKDFLPKDAKVVAKDGEFISNEEEIYKTSLEGEYKVSNNLHKYLEYAGGELGNPVRRRDKNYIETPEVDDLIMAIMSFDIRGIVNALSKMPKFNDGSAEKPFVGDNGIRARILLDTFMLGDKESVNGVIEVLVPDGYYINGNFMDESFKPYFVLKENKDIKHNIKNYEFYLPLANGVEFNGQTRRVFSGVVTFPFKINRGDLNKGMYFGGDFYFGLCDVYGVCNPYKTEHRIKLNKSLDAKESIYYNYVTQAHAHLPQNNAKDAKLKKVYFDNKNNELVVLIETNRKYSNVAVMVEDKEGNDFYNPRYQIHKDFIVAKFDVNLKATNKELKDVGVSASFDDVDTFRVKSEVYKDIDFSVFKNLISLKFMFGLGLLMNFFPCIFYLVLRCISFCSYKSEGIKIWCRYVLGIIFVSFIYILAVYYIGSYDCYIYFSLLSLIISVSLLVELLGFMDFKIFRPFKKFLKLGFGIGFCVGGIFVGYPYLTEDFINYVLNDDDRIYKIKLFMSFFWGFLLPSLFGLWLKYKKICIDVKLRAFNTLCVLFYILGLVWFLFAYLSKVSFVLIVLGGIGVYVIWYNYPFKINDVIKGKTLTPRNQKLFNTIQYKTFMSLMLVYLGMCLVGNIVGKKEIFNPSVNEINKAIEVSINNDRAFLISIDSKWSLKGIISKAILKRQEKLGLGIAYIDYGFDEENVKFWQNKYSNYSLPLYILFTKRHKNGLVLPQTIIDVNFYNAVKNF